MPGRDLEPVVDGRGRRWRSPAGRPARSTIDGGRPCCRRRRRVAERGAGGQGAHQGARVFVGPIRRLHRARARVGGDVGAHMRVAFDAHMIGERETGNESYALNLLRGLATLPDDDNQYGVLTPRPQALRKAITLPPRFEVVRVWPAASALRIPFGMPIALASRRSSLSHVTYIAPGRPG